MQFMLLVYGNQEAYDALADEARGAIVQEFFAYSDDLQQAGALVAGSACDPSGTAVVRVDDGSQIVTDGPFAETKEQVGGYFVIECDSIDEAHEWAARVPTVRYGDPVEVIPLMAIERSQTVEGSAR